MSTPLMRQYNEVKAQYPDCILFFRMGDFYELFGDDAVVASKILGITLTRRNHGKEGDMPLCGFPWHSAERYVPKMVAQGHKIAICEQVEDPKQAKGIVKRDVIEVITSGTALSENNLEAKANNFIVCLHPMGDEWQLACLDISTGDFSLTLAPQHQAECELNRLNPSEVLISEEFAQDLPNFLDEYLDGTRSTLSVLSPWKLDHQEGANFINQRLQIQGKELFGELSLGAAAALLCYAEDHKKRRLDHIEALQLRRLGEHMLLDPQTLRNLELLRPLNADDGDATLLHVLDYTGTSMGARLLRQWISHPLLSIPAIQERLDSVQEINQDGIRQEDLRKELSQINDIERICGKVGSGRVNARDLQGLGRSLVRAAEISQYVRTFHSTLVQSCDPGQEDLRIKSSRILDFLQDDLPTSLREGGMIRPGSSAELDALNEGIREAREWLSSLETRERSRTGITSLKVGFNKVFGYYLEVTAVHQDKVPQDYIRKQTLVGAERYITPEMKEYESLILGAEGRIFDLEYRLFCELRDEVHTWSAQMQQLARHLAVLDCLMSLAMASRRESYVRPLLSSDTGVHIQGGFHPVISRKLPRGQFITNDIELSPQGEKLMLITGPNMAGKSTYLRQTALIVLMAQIGCFVPAISAHIGIADRIFTRVGASDRLARGQSTFMVEMVETANILQHASDRSLILLDEIGRGTSTYDGLSLAWSIFEYLHDHADKRGRTLFATHYHEMTDLADRLAHAANYHISVKETHGELLFLRKILPGACDSSYGIQVARMAGVPQEVIQRAQELLLEFEDQGIRPQKVAANHHSPLENLPTKVKEVPKEKPQLDLFGGLQDPREGEVLGLLRKASVGEMRPIEALVLLDRLQGILGS